MCCSSNSSDYFVIVVVLIITQGPQPRAARSDIWPLWDRNDREYTIIITRPEYHHVYRAQSRGIFIDMGKQCYWSLINLRCLIAFNLPLNTTLCLPPY
ncbi:hypothetical protein RSAG8_06220, partial [Rhizoctonia solani AG-8 WAC10335]